MKIRRLFISLIAAVASMATSAQNNVAEEVAWVIGDQPIYKSEIEETYRQYLDEKIPINGNPYCVIPERMAIEKLFLNQAELDTVEVSLSMVNQQVEAWIQYLISQAGSAEQVEKWLRKSIPELRELRTELVSNQSRIEQVRSNLTKGLKVTPNDVRRYFNSLPEDSIPQIPMQVEVQIITINPAIPRQEIDDVKARLREFTDRVNSGDAEFSTLATLYSEDPGSARQGGEIGFMGRGQLEPEYAAVAFNLNDTKKVSKIVETQYGFHIIQLIEKRGDRVNTRHILLRPKVAEEDLTKAKLGLDTVAGYIRDGKYTFEEVAFEISQDKDTRNSRGQMSNEETGSTRFEMSQLPQEVAMKIDKMEPGDVSDAFIMMDANRNREIVAMVKLTSRIPVHKANLSDDFQTIKDMYEASAKKKIVDDWIAKKIKTTFVKIEDGWNDCQFEHQGWIK